MNGNNAELLHNLTEWLRRLDEKLDRLLAGQERLEKHIEEAEAEYKKLPHPMMEDLDFFLKSLN